LEPKILNSVFGSNATQAPIISHIQSKSRNMPEISRFYGLVITMHYNDHNPPHFHVRYGEHKALVTIQLLTVIQGELRSRALDLVVEWATLHQNELMQNWELARQEQTLQSIDPLE